MHDEVGATGVDQVDVLLSLGEGVPLHHGPRVEVIALFAVQDGAPEHTVVDLLIVPDGPVLAIGVHIRQVEVPEELRPLLAVCILVLF